MKGLLVNRFPKQALCLASTLLLSYDTKWLSANEIEVFIYQLCLLTKEPFLIFCLKIDTQERQKAVLCKIPGWVSTLPDDFRMAQKERLRHSKLKARVSLLLYYSWPVILWGSFISSISGMKETNYLIFIRLGQASTQWPNLHKSLGWTLECLIDLRMLKITQNSNTVQSRNKGSKGFFTAFSLSIG